MPEDTVDTATTDIDAAMHRFLPYLGHDPDLGRGGRVPRHSR